MSQKEPEKESEKGSKSGSDEHPETDESPEPEETFSQSSKESSDEDVVTYDIVYEDADTHSHRAEVGESYVKFKVLEEPPEQAEDQRSVPNMECYVYFKFAYSWRAKYSCKISADRKTFSDFTFRWMNEDMYNQTDGGPETLRFRCADTLDENGYEFLRIYVDCGYSGCAPTGMICWAKRRDYDPDADFPLTITNDECQRLELPISDESE